MPESTPEHSADASDGATSVKQEWHAPALRTLGDLRTLTEAGNVPGGDGGGSSHIVS
jgi:hypothetical protein